MNILESLRVSWSALASNRMRSLLTMLGVIIGVATVVTLVSLGQAVQTKITDTVGAMGTSMIRVDTFLGYARLTPEDGQMVLERVPTVSHYTPWLAVTTTAKRGTTKIDTELHGVNHHLLSIVTYEIAEGRMFNEREVASRQNVAVIGATVRKKLFGDRPVLGEAINIRGESFIVIGAFKSKGVLMGQDVDDAIYIPYTTAQRIVGTRYVQMFMFKARSAEEAQAAKTHITRVLEIRFRNEQRPIDDILRRKPFHVMSMDELISTIKTVTATFTVFLAGIAAVSLLVGGVGIMNIMLVSVTERTREIGIRKAIGARRMDILAQFLIESVILSGTGGVIGLLAGAGLAEAIGKIGQLNVTVSPIAILVSFSFACAVGVFFGVYPAMKAANLDPIVALRYE